MDYKLNITYKQYQSKEEKVGVASRRRRDKPHFDFIIGRAEMEHRQMKEGTMERRGTTINKFILLTLTHADRRPTAKKELVRDRLRQLFDCRAVLVAKKAHSEGGYHLHAGVFKRNASKQSRHPD